MLTLSFARTVSTRLVCLGTLLAAGLLAGCVTETQTAAPTPALHQTSVVSTSAAKFQPRPGETVAWKDGISVHSPDNITVPQELVDDLKAKIDTQLVAKGYAFTPAGQQADYLIHGLIVMGNELNEQQLRDVLGFEPGLVSHSQQYEKGSLLLMLVDPDTQLTDWRAVVQVFTSDELTNEQREQRFEYIIRSLLRPLPGLKG